MYSDAVMLMLVLFLVIGSSLVYISKFNFVPVTVNLGLYVVSDIPLFYVIVGSIVVGLVLSYLIYFVNSIGTSFKIRGKDREIKKNKGEVLDLTKRVHQLELDKEKLKHNPSLEPDDTDAL